MSKVPLKVTSFKNKTVSKGDYMSCGKKNVHVPRDGDVFKTEWFDTEYVLIRDYYDDPEEDADTWTVYFKTGRTSYLDTEVREYFRDGRWIYVRNMFDTLKD